MKVYKLNERQIKLVIECINEINAEIKKTAQKF